MKTLLNCIFVVLVLALFGAVGMAQEIVPYGTSVTPVEPSVTFALSQLVVIVLATGGIIIGTVGYLRRKDVGGADHYLQMQLDAQRQQRELMEAYERMYGNLPVYYKSAFDSLQKATEFIANFTPFAADDSLAKWLKDIKTPGAQS